MKTFVNVLWYCWVAAGLLFCSWMIWHVYDTYAKEKLVAQLGEMQEEVEEKIQGKVQQQGFELENVLVLDGNIADRSLGKVELYYQTVPWEIRKQFVKDGWKLAVTDRDISSAYYDGPVKGELAGLTDSRVKTIYIHEKVHHIRNALLHEFGHYFDLRVGIASDEDGFMSCYEKEKDVFVRPWKSDTHAMSNTAEYFAESFQRFILEPETCKETQPLTYEYIKIRLEDVSKNF